MAHGRPDHGTELPRWFSTEQCLTVFCMLGTSRDVKCSEIALSQLESMQARDAAKGKRIYPSAETRARWQESQDISGNAYGTLTEYCSVLRVKWAARKDILERMRHDVQSCLLSLWMVIEDKLFRRVRGSVSGSGRKG